MSEILRIHSVSEVHDYFGFDKPKHPLVSVIRIGEKVKTFDFSDIKYVLEMYQIHFKGKMSGSFGYGRNSYDFQEGTMTFVGPGQTIQFDQDHIQEADGSAWTLLFHPDLLRKSELSNKIEDYSFFAYETNEALHLSDEEKSSLFDILSKIEQEYNQNIDRHSQDLIISNIKLMLDYCTRYFDRQFYTRTNMHKDVVSGFERLLKDYYKAGKAESLGIPSVTFCGRQLGMSPYYLSDLLKKETGRNAQEHIHFFIIDRAKTELLNSEDSVSQIAYELGFEYPQHFSKVFKKKTGMSPSQYRNLN